MKAFFEEYGFVLVSVAVIAMLITIVGTKDSGITKSISDGLTSTVSGMTEKLTKEFPVTPAS